MTKWPFVSLQVVVDCFELSCMRDSADCTTGFIPAECSGMAVDLVVVALLASSICDVIVQLTFTDTDNEVLASIAGFIDGSCKVMTTVEFTLRFCRLVGVSHRGVCP